MEVPQIRLPHFGLFELSQGRDYEEHGPDMERVIAGRGVRELQGRESRHLLGLIFFN